MSSLLVGLTGGIGSGKTLVAKIFSLLNIPVYSADEQAKQLMVSDEELKKEIIQTFGTKSYLTTGFLNRTYLSSHIFSDPDQLIRMNHLVHPRVEFHFNTWCSQQSAPYLIKESALLLSPEQPKKMNYYIAIVAPEALRLQRILHRDKTRSAEEIKHIMALQSNQEYICKEADFVVSNDEKNLLLPQVIELHRNLMDRSKDIKNLIKNN